MTAPFVRHGVASDSHFIAEALTEDHSGELLPSATIDAIWTTTGKFIACQPNRAMIEAAGLLPLSAASSLEGYPPTMFTVPPNFGALPTGPALKSIMTRKLLPQSILALILFLFDNANSAAQGPIVIDAHEPEIKPAALTTHLGTSIDPQGHTLGANSLYLTRDGRPWLPVMGELHYSRVPEAEWESSILKMKAAGVDIISSYVIWIHHEQVEGQFNWKGNRDIRRFAQVCARHGMYFYPRLGPWSHGEVRNGGFPDWVVERGHTRENDPQYLREVDSLFQQIGDQLQGLYWKDGGPVIGVQIENEYRGLSPRLGAEHIRTLKKMAIDAGIDVPFYTVTGWDNAVVPRDVVLPVYGGYPDAPWDSTPQAIAAPEVYAFRFENRSAGNMGAIGGNGQGPATAYTAVPFLTAEVGGGIQDTYFRRPVVSADDIAAIQPVLIGSGANVFGYYMFAGGRNPDGGNITLQESQRTGYPTDVPTKSYDFQAPISNNGVERLSLRRLKLVHYFLNDFGEVLAPMQLQVPTLTPKTGDDVQTPRVSARTRGDRGFIFFNNHNRNVHVKSVIGFQVRLVLPSETIQIPEEPINLPEGAYGIWPANLNVGPMLLKYSTAQLFKRVIRNSEEYLLFFQIPGITPEFSLDGLNKGKIEADGFESLPTRHSTLLRPREGANEITIRSAGKSIHLLLFSRADAEQIWKTDCPSSLVRTDADFYGHGKAFTLQQVDKRDFRFAFFSPQESGSTSLHRDFFIEHHKTLPTMKITAKVAINKKPLERAEPSLGPEFSWRKRRIPIAPDDADFQRAGVWLLQISTPRNRESNLDIFLRIRYQGDVARLTQDGRVLDDDFWNSNPWFVSTKNVAMDLSRPAELRILPFPKDATVYLEKKESLSSNAFDGNFVNLEDVTALPVYRLNLQLP
jgi:hypothetical protein